MSELGVKLLQGNCVELLPGIPGASIDLTVTSPPYDNLRTYNDSLEWGEHVWKPVLEELFRVTKKGGVVVWVVNDATINGSETGTSFRQALWAMECGFRLHDTMIWRKLAIPYDPKCERYWQAFEYMFVLSKGKPKCNYIKVPCDFSGARKMNNYGQRNQDGSLRTDRNQKNRIIKETKPRDNVWFIPNTGQSGDHPASYPYRLAHDHIISWSNKGDTVLDPFLGSGTTGKAAQNLGRNFIGMERDEEYFRIAERWILRGWNGARERKIRNKLKKRTRKK